MRLLFSPQAAAQHLFPMVPLAWAARAAGHEVLIAGAPALADVIVHTGLPGVIVGRDTPQPTRQDSGGVSMVYGHRRFPPDWPLHPHRLDEAQRAVVELLGRNSAAVAEYTVDDLIAFGRHWQPDLVVHDTASFAGAVAAAVLDVPNVRYLTGVGLRPMETMVGSPEPLPEYAALFHRRGVDARVVPTMTIDPSPPSLRLPVTGPCREARYVPYNGPGVTPSWLGVPPTRQRICVTWGYSALRETRKLGPRAMDPFRQAVASVSDLDAEVVVATTAEQFELLGDLPVGVRSVAGVPLHLVLPHCAAIVHQAGDGTALTAAAAGVPQLAITRKPDPALTGGRLAAIGVGVHLRYQELADEPDRGAVIRAAAEKLLADAAYADAAARLREEIEHQPTPAQLVAVLAALATRSSK